MTRSTDHRPPEVRKQARQHADEARSRMDARRRQQDDGLTGWLNKRAGDWELSPADEPTMQRQKYVWNFLVDHWFRMEFDGWENLPDSPVLLVGIHSGAPFVWDAWTVGVQWWRRFGQNRARRADGHAAHRSLLPGDGCAARSTGLHGHGIGGGPRRGGVARR
jgi:hypothetical protein